MTPRSEKELRELDAWISQNVFNRHKAVTPNHYTTDPAAAMAVWRRCLVETRTHPQGELQTWESIDGATVHCAIFEKEIHVQAPTMELVICLFAQKLFKKN